MDCDELIYACALNKIFNFSCKTAKTIFDKFGNTAPVFSLPRKELEEIFGTKSKFVNEILNRNNLVEAEKEIEWAKRNNVRILYIGDREYPKSLKECCDAPLILYFFGNKLPSGKRNVAIVGTRKATSYGISQCRDIVSHLAELAEPPAIISGLAYGIDINAHLAAMDEGLDTYTVMATGIDKIYPASHRIFAEKIAKHGGLLTDFNRKCSPEKINFLKRNRIIAGMSDAVILIESDVKGGGMTTARMATSYDREVFALPGRIGDRFSSGCNKLIEDNNARIITSPESISQYMSWDIGQKMKNKSKFANLIKSCNEIKRNILAALSVESFLDKNTLIERAECTPKEALVNITELELDGVIEMDFYGNYKLTK